MRQTGAAAAPTDWRKVRRDWPALVVVRLTLDNLRNVAISLITLGRQVKLDSILDMRVVQVVATAILIGVFIVFAIANSVYALQKKSLVPLIGGGAGFVGFALIPLLRPFCWLPLITDLGMIMIPVAFVVHWLEIWHRK